MTLREIKTARSLKKKSKKKIIRKVAALEKLKPIFTINKTYHGTIDKHVRSIASKGLDVKRSRGESVGIYNSISVTDNLLLAKSMIKGEIGLSKEGKVFAIDKIFRIIDLRTKEGEKYWESLDRSPSKAIKENIDDIAFTNYEMIRIKAFYKDIPLAKVEDALEIQLFESVKPKFMKQSETKSKRRK